MKPQNNDIALFKSVTERDYEELVGMDSVLTGIAQGRWAALIAPIRSLAAEMEQLHNLVSGMEAKGSGHPEYSQQVMDKMKARLKDLDARKTGLKHRVPVYMPAGHCSQGKKDADFAVHSGYMGIDADLNSAAEAEHLRDTLFGSCQWVRAAYRSASGDGVHFIVRVDEQTTGTWNRTYQSVMRYLKHHFGLKADGACKNIARVFCVSHDPDMKLRTWDETSAYPMDEEESEFRAALQAQAAASFQPSGSPLAGDDMPTGQTYTPGDGRRMLNHYLRYHPLTDSGSRHPNLVTVLAALRRNGCTDMEYEEISSVLLTEYPAPGFSVGEIQKAIAWARDIPVDPACWRMRQNTNLSNYHYAHTHTPSAAGTAGNEVEYSTVNANLPTFSDKVKLPDFFKKVIKLGENDEQRDVLAVSMMAYLGAVMPKMMTCYGRGSKHYYPNLIVVVIGRSTSRKSLALLPDAMMSLLNQRFDVENEERLRQFGCDKADYDEYQKLSRKERKEHGPMSCPSEPRMRYFKQMLSTSRSQLVMNLVDSEEYGAYAVAPELDQLTAALGTDYGHYSADIRAMAEHEEVGQHYKTDGRQIKAEHPKFSLILTGTDSQWARFVPSHEDGTGNRLLPYYMSGTSGWVNQFAGDGEEDLMEVFSDLAPQVVEMYDFLREYPARVRLTAEQRDEFNAFFDGRCKRLGTDLNDVFEGIIRRGGVSAIRMCTILTGVRKFDERNTASVVYCHDADFSAVMGMMDVLLDHAFFMTRLSPDNGKPVQIHEANYVTTIWLDAMAHEFQRKDVLQYVELHKLDRSSASLSRDLDRLVESGQIVRLSQGHYAKS